MKWILCLAAIFTVARAVPVCHSGICNTVRCAMVMADTCNGKVEPHGGFCGCCPQCVAQLTAGQACRISLFAGIEPHTAECGAGLHCDTTTHTCVHTKTGKRDVAGPCEQRLKDYLSKTVGLLGATKPACETDGTFSPKQCKGSGCSCVDPAGNDLGYFTTFGQGTDNMDCKCARDLHAYMKSGMIGKFFYCDKKGSYDKVQCLGSVCYCTDENGRALTNSGGVAIQNKDTLTC